MPDIAIEGGEVVPRSIGEKIPPHQRIWTPLSRRIGMIPAAAYTGETPIHRAQKLLSIPRSYPIIFERPTPVYDFLKTLLPAGGILQRKI